MWVSFAFAGVPEPNTDNCEFPLVGAESAFVDLYGAGGHLARGELCAPQVVARAAQGQT
jgi:hypothetical protein